MENTLGKGVSYNPFKTEDKHYFGGFFNLADNNIKETFAEVKQRLNNKDFYLRDTIEKYTKEDTSLVDFEKFVHLLSDYFPIVKEVDQINHNTKDKNGNPIPKTKKQRLEYFKETFLLLSNSIDTLRNYYTHYYHDTIELDPKLFTFLDNVLLKTVLDTKKNYLKEDKTKEMIKDNLKEDFDKIFNLKVEEYLEKDNNTSKKIKKAKKYGNGFDEKLTKEITAAIYNDAIKDFIYDKGKVAELSNSRKTSYNDKDFHAKNGDEYFYLPISSSGIIFLLSCFLNRKELENLKANIRGYKGKIPKESITLKNNGVRFMTTHRIYSFWHYKGLKNKIKTSENATKETLLMQMIDELSKVPHVIYQNVSDTLQKSFIEDWNEYFKDNEENNENLENSKVVHPVIRKRYEDKFNYFAIRFLDTFINFPTLRFQVYMGNYLVHSMPKQNANVITERKIKKKIFVFGKLNEVNQLKSDFFDVINETNTDTNWEIFPNPNYHFPMENSDKLKKANKIGIHISVINTRINDFKKQSNKNSNQDKIGWIEQIIQQNQNIKVGQPLAYLSMNDIHSIIFEALNNPKSKDEKIDGKYIEKKIRNQINKQVEEILNKNQDAKIIKNHLKKAETNINLTKLIKDVEKEIVITKNKFEELTEKINKYDAYQKVKGGGRIKVEKRKHILYNSEKGEIATWLANDIKRFFPKEFKENWKGHQHSEFQLNLAYYDTQKEEVKLLLDGLNYRKHIPMIDFFKQTFLEFYMEYLKKREVEFTNLSADLEKLNKGEQVNKDKLLTKCFTLFKKKNYQNKPIDDKIASILANPIFIERGFMDSKPTIIAGKKFSENKNEFADWFVAFKEFNDYQKFYDSKKYPIEAYQKSKTETNKLNTKIYTQKKNDWAIWQMIQYIFKDFFKDIFKQDMQNISLAELYQSRAERLKNKAHAKDGDRNQNFIWNRNIDLQLNDKINIPNVKLKDIGNFRKYEKDQRILTFLSYGEIANWMAYLPNNWKEDHDNKPINVIDIQIDDYEKIRQNELLKEVQKLESEIYRKVENKEKLIQNGNQNFKQYIVKGLLAEIKSINVDEFKVLQEDTNFDKLDFKIVKDCFKIEQYAILLILIRNKFAHNQLPNKEAYEFCQTILKREETQTYANYYLELFKKLKLEI
ncbi:MAG: type VI-B CRISPR-associated RNA-guided ribonuclease Cas13b [Flavobacteriaceae bacterium]|nr:type VI-B CRISPR-associated RNA-guided ribonuclease Cas13b [Flavobacteriaceae bacterium]